VSSAEGHFVQRLSKSITCTGTDKTKKAK